MIMRTIPGIVGWTSFVSVLVIAAWSTFAFPAINASARVAGDQKAVSSQPTISRAAADPEKSSPPKSATARSDASPPGPNAAFKDITQAAGVGHRHHGPFLDNRLKNMGPWFTALGAGGAVGDYDNDGDEDIYVTDSLRGTPNVLYRNNGDLTFTDVAAPAGVAALNDEKNFSTMALFFDCDSDGWKDLFVVRFGLSKLFHNRGNGTFEDISGKSEIPIDRNAVAVVAIDYDRDSDLDLYVGSYFPDVDLTTVRTTKLLHDSWESARNGGTNYLLRNEGGCRFVEKSKEVGLADTGWTLAVGTDDMDHDGWTDIYIANDFGADKVYRNLRNGKFADVSESAIGVDTKKSMNAEFGDYDNDGWSDIYVTNITEPFLNECNMLWRNNGNFTFSDVALTTNTCDTDWGWGAKFLDYDNDGKLDLYVATGFISGGDEDYIDILMPIILDSEVDLSDTMSWPALGARSFSGHEPNRLFHNNGGHSFTDTAPQNGVDTRRDSRGVIVADFDNDGMQDLYVLNSNQEAQMYRGQPPAENSWIQLQLQGVRSNRDGLGTRVTMYTPDGLFYRESNAGNGFESQSTSSIHVGTGKAQQIDRLVVEWLSGEKQEFKNVKARKRYRLIEGQGLTEIAASGAAPPKIRDAR